MALTFKDVPIGDPFNFTPSSDGFHHDRNTYVKTSARGYQRIDTTGGLINPAHKVGTIRVPVEYAPTQSLTKDQRFFFDHAGFSCGPGETVAQGRTRCAIALATAEDLYMQAHRVADVCITWEDDPLGWSAWEADKRAGHVSGKRPATIEDAWIAIDGTSVASLGGIQDADDDYRRVVRAELASECANELQRIIDNAS